MALLAIEILRGVTDNGFSQPLNDCVVVLAVVLHCGGGDDAPPPLG